MTRNCNIRIYLSDCAGAVNWDQRPLAGECGSAARSGLHLAGYLHAPADQQQIRAVYPQFHAVSGRFDQALVEGAIAQLERLVIGNHGEKASPSWSTMMAQDLNLPRRRRRRPCSQPRIWDSRYLKFNPERRFFAAARMLRLIDKMRRELANRHLEEDAS